MRKNIQDTCSKFKENAQNNLNDRIYFARFKVHIILQIAIKIFVKKHTIETRYA